jgi:hypothetical protein
MDADSSTDSDYRARINENLSAEVAVVSDEEGHNPLLGGHRSVLV